jgi:hypothetical protein
MPIPTIRKALEIRLAAVAPAIQTAFENAAFTPVAGTPFQRVNLLPNTPDNSIQGVTTYFERGLFQVKLCYPIGTGPTAAETQAQLIRAHFKRGTSLLNSGVTVIITDTPRVSTGMIEGDRFCIPVSVPWQAQINT